MIDCRDCRDCRDCTAAASSVWHGFTAGCSGCSARALARSPAFAEAKRTGRLPQAYRSALTLALVSHDEVKAAAGRDFMGKEAA